MGPCSQELPRVRKRMFPETGIPGSGCREPSLNSATSAGMVSLYCLAPSAEQALSAALPGRMGGTPSTLRVSAVEREPSKLWHLKYSVQIGSEGLPIMQVPVSLCGSLVPEYS